MYILGLILAGLVIGALGRLVHPGADPMPKRSRVRQRGSKLVNLVRLRRTRFKGAPGRVRNGGSP